MTPEANDADIIGASRDSPERFVDLYDRHAAEIHRFAARRLSRQQADDITSETFLIAFKARDRFDPERESARPWLYGIASNLVLRQRRSEARALRALARTGVDPVAESWEDGAADRVSAQSSQALLAGALADLGAGDRQVLLLIAWSDLTYQEVAEALSIPIGTVRSRLNRARTRIRAWLADEPHFNETLTEVVRHG